MEGFEVVSSDHDSIGRVVGEVDDWLIVEQGTLRKSRHPLPKTFATVLVDKREVCVNLPKNLIDDSPKVGDGNQFDRDAAAMHYGLASAYEEPPAEGYGDTVGDDPAWGPDVDAAAAGMQPAEQQRAQIREHGRQQSGPSSPGLLGGRTPERRSD